MPFVTERFLPSCDTGLSKEQVEQRKKENAVNVITDNNSITIRGIIYRNVFTYFNLIFAGLAGLLILVKSYRGLTFMPIIIINTLIGIVQQIRSKITLDKLNMLNAPHAVLVRSGRYVGRTRRRCYIFTGKSDLRGRDYNARRGDRKRIAAYRRGG